MLPFKLGVFTVRVGSVFIKKSNQTENFFFKKKNRNRFKPTGFSSVRFSFLEQKPVWLGFFSLARFWLGFFRFGSVLARFFRFWLGLARFFVRFFSVRFGFSGSRLKKPKPNRTGRFFQKFNFFFHDLVFFIFFSVFSV